MFDFLDLNHDGHIDPFESALGMMMADGILSEDEAESDLESAGLDAFDLSLMDDDERRETLEDAGLDPDDYSDFDF